MEALQIKIYFCKRCPSILHVTEEELLINEVVHSSSLEKSKPPKTQTGVCTVAKIKLGIHSQWRVIVSPQVAATTTSSSSGCKILLQVKSSSKRKICLVKSGQSVLTFHPWMYHRFVFWNSVTVIWINMEQLMDWRSYVQLFSNLFLS